MMLQLVMEEQRFATVMWGGFDFIADAGGSDPVRREWLMECSGLQVSAVKLHKACRLTGNYVNFHGAADTCC